MISAKRKFPIKYCKTSLRNTHTTNPSCRDTDGVISYEIYDEVQRSNIFPLRALSGIVSGNSNK